LVSALSRELSVMRTSAENSKKLVLSEAKDLLFRGKRRQLHNLARNQLIEQATERLPLKARFLTSNRQ